MDSLVLGQQLRHHRRRRGLTLEELGDLIDRPASFLSLVENGKRDVTVSQVRRLAEALRVDTADLLDEEPPSRRARLEIELERMQRHPRHAELGLPHLKATASLPDLAIEHLLALFAELTADGAVPLAQDVRSANGALTRWLRERDGHLEHVEAAAADTLSRSGYAGPGPVTGREIGEIVRALGFSIHPVEDVPSSVRSIVERRSRRIYVAQRNELRTRQARKAILQTIGAEVLGHHTSPSTTLELLRRRLETAVFAAAVLVPERSAVPFLRAARNDRDLSIEDVKEQFYVSYEMAAQRFTNLATRHLGLVTHFVRNDEDGVISKAYANDDAPLPTDREGGHDGQRLCRMWGARAAFRSADRFDLHHQFTDTPTGSFWSVTHISPDDAGDAFTVGVRFEDARLFRGRGTRHHLVSACPDGVCCRHPEEEASAPWEGAVTVHPRLQARVLGMLEPDLDARMDPSAVIEFVERHSSDPGLPDDEDAV